MDWDLVVEKVFLVVEVVFLEVEVVFLVEVVARSEETSDSLVHVVQSLEGGVKLQNKQKATNKIAEHASKVKYIREGIQN